MNTIKPTIGRIVLVALFGATVPAIVNAVHSDDTIGVTAFPYNAVPEILPTVTYHEAGEGEMPRDLSWHWMPHQKEQAAKTETVRNAVKETTATHFVSIADRRQVTGHEVNPANIAIKIYADDPGLGAASHEYHVRIGDFKDEQVIRFQNGPVNEDGNGLNGTTHEVLLTIVADRLRAFQNGPYASKHNAAALSHVKAARENLLRRTRERMARGGEGTHKV